MKQKKLLYFVYLFILVVSLLLSGCQSQTPVGSETSASTGDEMQTPGVTTDDKIGGILITDITEVTYHGADLKTCAERIADILEDRGATGVRVFEGMPSSDAFAIELGCEEGDSRMSEIADDTALLTSDGGWIFAATKGDDYSHQYAVNILESYIINNRQQTVFEKKIKLQEVIGMENGTATLKQLKTFEDNSDVYFEGTTLGNAIENKVGDQLVFEIQMKKNKEKVGCPKFKYTVKCDDGKTAEGIVDGTGGKLQLFTTITKPGFVRVSVQALDASGTAISKASIYEGGAGADIEQISQSIAEPDDFDAFWRAQLAKLDEVPLEVISQKEIPVGNPDYTVYDVQIKCVGEMPASGVLTIPKNAQAKSLPVRMQFYGYGAISKANPLYDANAITFSVNPHGVVNSGKPDSYYSDYHAQVYPFGFDIVENMDPNTSYFLNMILRDVQATRFAMTLPEYDGNGVEFVGGSMGAFQSICVAALIGENAKFLDLGYAWLSDLGGVTVGKLGPDWGPALTDGNGNIVKGLLYFDTVNHAKRITCQVKIGSRLGDYICPPSGQVVLYHAFASENKVMTFRQNATHSYVSPSDITYSVRWK